jgi:hypothetical protein
MVRISMPQTNRTPLRKIDNWIIRISADLAFAVSLKNNNFGGTGSGTKADHPLTNRVTP